MPNYKVDHKLDVISFGRAYDVEKGWGKEVSITNYGIISDENFPTGYSGKLLVYTKGGTQSSMHYHTVKHETFYVLDGEIVFSYYNPDNADLMRRRLGPGDVVEIPPNNPH